MDENKEFWEKAIRSYLDEENRLPPREKVWWDHGWMLFVIWGVVVWLALKLPGLWALLCEITYNPIVQGP